MHMLLFLLIQLSTTTALSSTASRSFSVDYQSNTFLKDGKPFRYISGSIHYFRIPYQLWEDRLYKAKMIGLNTIQTYVAWNRHAIYENVHDFSGDLDIVSFIKLVQQNNMYVLLRPGPYIDSEWEYGGFPYWLIKKVPKAIRTADEEYIGLVDEWFSVLLPKIKPLLYINGGPIIGLQVENEYGSYGCDANYIQQMENLMRKYLGDEVYLYTTDTIVDQAIHCGSSSMTSSVYTTVDFGAGNNVNKSFALQRKHQPNGPYVNSEFYTGWFDNWGEGHHTESPEYIASALDRILAFSNASSVNMYIFAGGTNYNFMNGGSYIADLYLPITTSYDFDAPLNEAGDPTEKYWQLQNVISRYNDIPSGPQPAPSWKLPHMKILLDASVSFFILSEIIQAYLFNTPASFEFLDLAYGYMWYQIQLNQSDHVISFNQDGQQLLDLGKFRDTAYIYSNLNFQGVLSRNGGSQLNISISSEDVLSIIVENEGRTCFSDAIQDVRKGILSNRIELNGVPLSGWLHYRYGLYPPDNHYVNNNTTTSNSFTDTMKRINAILDDDSHNNIDDTSLPLAKVPGMYRFQFKLDHVADTYLKLNQWEKGVATINGIKVLKYWTSRGPQKTLYIPRTDLIVGDNQITLTEFVHAPTSVDEAFIELVEEPIYV